MQRLQPSFLLGGRYRLSNRIARGGMGEVWSAHDQVLDRPVAVKIMHPHTATEKAFVARFHEEAKLAARLRSPHVIEAYDYGEDAELAFLVMELMPGTTVSNEITTHGRLPAERVAQIIADTATALATAHEAGVIHRDVKPSNILLSTDGTAKLGDFGIARALDGASHTRTGEMFGTPQYLSPEQARGEPATASSDLYCLGVVAHEMLTGTRPFDKPTPIATALAHVQEPPPPLPPRRPAAARGHRRGVPRQGPCRSARLRPDDRRDAALVPAPGTRVRSRDRSRYGPSPGAPTPRPPGVPGRLAGGAGGHYLPRGDVVVRAATMPVRPAQVLLADDHALVRQGVRMILNAQPDFTVAAEVGDGAAAVERISAGGIDLAILDITMPRMTGLQAARELSRRGSKVPILILSMHDNEQYLFEALKNGACGYVHKSEADRDLISACRSALRGEPFLYPGAVNRLIRDYVARRTDESPTSLLTPREEEILKLIAEGHSGKEIADLLVLSPKTVERHRANLLEKLGMRDRLELTRFAIRTGLIEP